MRPPLVMNTLTIRHRGEDQKFRMVKGGYCFDRKGITISIETQTEDRVSPYPYSALFSLVNYPMGEAALKVGARFSFSDRHPTGFDDENTHANAYFDFHAETVKLSFKVLAVDADALTLELSAKTEDYGYEVRRGKMIKINAMAGVFQLAKKSKSELWIPT
jgi:hypothetical protein